MRVRAAVIVVAVACGAVLLLRYTRGIRAFPLEYSALREVHELPGLGFLKAGREVVYACEIVSTPVILEPYLVLEGRARSIAGPDDLVGHVEVRSADQALRYARLLTRSAVPPDSRDHSGEVALEGDPELDRMPRDGTPRSHVGTRLSASQWKQDGLSLATARRSGDSFLITRYLFPISSPATAVY